MPFFSRQLTNFSLTTIGFKLSPRKTFEYLSHPKPQTQRGSELAKVTIEFDDGRVIVLTPPDSVVERLIAEMTVSDTNPILDDILSLIKLESARISKQYELSPYLTAHLKVTPKVVRLSIEVCGDYYTIFRSSREEFSVDDFREIVEELYNNTKRFVFDVITRENTNVRIHGVYPSKYAKFLNDFLEEFNIRFAVAKPEFADEDVKALMFSNAHFVIGVYREELEDIPSGVLGSLVRKGQILTEKDVKVYIPNPNREETFLSKRERNALEKIERIVNGRLRKLNRLYGTDLKLEDVAWKL